MRLCVIGAGVLGLTIAYELSSRGHEVVVMDRDEPFAGASHRSFAWVNANNKHPWSYHRINALGVAEHEHFQEQFPSQAVWLHMSGNILADFSARRNATYADRRRDAEEQGYPVHLLERAELRKKEPAIHWSEDLDTALFFPREGYLDNDILAHELLTALSDRGVEVERAQAEQVDSVPDHATVRTSGGVRRFDRVVVTAGAESGALAEESGFQIPVADLSTPSPRTHSLLGLTEETSLGLSHVVISDRINVRPRHDGRLWVQVPHIEHRVQEGDTPQLLEDVGSVMEDEAERLFGVRIAMEQVIFSGRSFPEDGVSIIGYLDEPQNIYCAVTHSGMTLAPLFARLGAEELEGGHSSLLDDFRPSRFAHGVNQISDEHVIGKQ